jgi:hypothetical protein
VHHKGLGQTGFWEKTKRRRELPQEHFHSFCQTVRELIGSVNTSAFSGPCRFCLNRPQ